MPKLQAMKEKQNNKYYLWRKTPGFGAFGVVGCPHCVDVAQNLKINHTSL